LHIKDILNRTVLFDSYQSIAVKQPILREDTIEQSFSQQSNFVGNQAHITSNTRLRIESLLVNNIDVFI